MYLFLQFYFAGTYRAQEWNRAGKFSDLNVSNFFPPIPSVVLSYKLNWSMLTMINNL